jgi:hypothetical protein
LIYGFSYRCRSTIAGFNFHQQSTKGKGKKKLFSKFFYDGLISSHVWDGEVAPGEMSRNYAR